MDHCWQVLTMAASEHPLMFLRHLNPFFWPWQFGPHQRHSGLYATSIWWFVYIKLPHVELNSIFTKFYNYIALKRLLYEIRIYETIKISNESRCWMLNSQFRIYVALYHSWLAITNTSPSNCSAPIIFCTKQSVELIRSVVKKGRLSSETLLVVAFVSEDELHMAIKVPDHYSGWIEVTLNA